MTISINAKNLFNDVAAEMRASSANDIIVPTSIGLLVLVAVFQMAPMLGSSLDNAVDLGHDVSATGMLVITGSVVDGETVTIGTVVFEFDSIGGVAPGNVAVPISDSAASTAAAALVAAIENNEAAAAIVTAAVEE